MAEKRVISQHPKTGERYGVTLAVHEKVYAPRGFKIVSYEDQTPYEAKAQPRAAKPAASPRAEVKPPPEESPAESAPEG